MAEENNITKKKIDINTYRFASGQTIDEILKTQTSWATDNECLSNIIDSNWRAVDDFITDKEKELAKKFLMASNNPEVDLKLLAVQSEVATQYLCQKHTNQELWEKARNDPKRMTRPFSKDVVNIENQINFSYELPSWMKSNLEEIPNNWFQKTPEQLQKEQEKEDIKTTVALNTVTKNIVILPYSRKPEDIEAMKSFIANVSENNIENITNVQAQAFIDNIGNKENCSLTAWENGTFEWIDQESFSSITDTKEILSIIDDYAKDHITGFEQNSEQIKDFEYIHSINEKVNVFKNNKALNKDIFIEPYSRKPEDIEAMKLFVSNVSGNDVEIITKEHAQAFIDNLGITEEAYLTAKADGTFEYTNNNPYSPDIYKTSEPKEILSIIEDYANDHLTGVSPNSEQARDFVFIHSINEKLKDNEKISLLTNQLENANKTIQEQNQLLNGKGSVKVNGIERNFEHGLKHAFPEAVKQLDKQIQINKDLTRTYNELAKSKSNDISPVSLSDDGNTYS